MKSKKDNYSYKGWLTSDKFMKRAFACLGYQTVSILIIYAAVLAIIIVFAALFGFLGLITSLFIT